MIVKPVIAGLLGFDVNMPLSASEAIAFKSTGYDFCIRYLPRTSALTKGNLTVTEIESILSAGLSLGAVQHVPEPGWNPTAALGTQYGQYAGLYSAEIGLPAGINIWLDLEEVAHTATAQDVIDYCQAWYAAVKAAGYVPGIYIGWNVILTPAQLYKNLSFKHYWRAYNGGAVATRGFQIIQETQKRLNGIYFDPNISQADNLGDTAIFVSPS